MLVRRINETESGFLPTPVKYDSHGTWESNNYHGLGWSAKNAPDRLDEKSRGRARMWPTPVKSEEAAARYTIETSHRHFAEGSHQVHLAQAARDPRLWPGQVKYSTPTKTQIRVPPERLEERMGDRKRGGETTVPLNEQVMRHELVAHRRMYATPIRSDATVSKGRNVLQMVADGEAYDQLARQVRREEMEAAGEAVVPRRRVPTPTAHDAKSPHSPEAIERRSGMNLGLSDAVRGEMVRERRQVLPTPTSENGLRSSSQSDHWPGKWQSPGHPEYGELNPEWVEWIMGWPIGWTSLDPMDPARFEQWWALMSAHPETGYGLWWDSDPSDFPEAGVPKTVKPKDTEENVRRVARIAALGNGQVSAVIPAQLLELTTMKLPPED